MRRGWTIPAGACLLASACAASTGTRAPAVPYLSDAAFRRAELAASLVQPSDGYARLRLAHYATGDAADWERLPEYDPAVEPLGAAELDAPAGASPTALSARARALALPASVASEDDPALVALGEAAFRLYPVQLTPYLRVALASRAAAARYGLWVDDAAGVGGLVRVRQADGTGALAVTCATCHEARLDGPLVPGLPDATLRLGEAILDASPRTFDARYTAAVMAWGPGRLDVSTTEGDSPVRIADLRPVRWLSHLQADATVARRDRTALAMRIETLVVTSHSMLVRPPRVVALALAAYVESLADALPDPDAAARASPTGARLFASRCEACHQARSLAGPPVPLDVVGTDPTQGLSSSRGTGTYRVPSLHGVGTRGPLLHDGTVPSVDAMLDPARLEPGYTGRLHGAGAIPGHTFGLDLSAVDRAALVSYVEAL